MEPLLEQVNYHYQDHYFQPVIHQSYRYLILYTILMQITHVDHDIQDRIDESPIK